MTSEAEPATPRSTALERILATLLVAGTLGFVVDHVARTDFRYFLWSDRDMVRSDVSFWELPTMGAELSFGVGARIPGGAMHTLLWLALCVRDDPRFAWTVQWALLMVAAAWLGRDLRRRLGALPGAMTFAALAASPVVWSNFRTLWNPGWTPLFTAIAVWAWMRAVLDRDGRGVVAFAWCLTIGATAHLSVLLLAACLVPVYVASRPAMSWRWLAAAAAAVIATYVPYGIDDARHGWWNTRATFSPIQVAGVAPPAVVGDVWTEVSGIAAGLSGWSALGLEAMPRPPGVALVLAAAGVAGLAWRRRGRADGRLLAASASVLVLFAGAYAMSSVDAGYLADTRYILVATPVVAVLVGALTSTITGAAPWLRAALGCGLVALPIGLQVVGRAQADRALIRPELVDYDNLVSWTAAVRAQTGWSRAELAGRTLAASFRGDELKRQGAVPYAWPLAQAGEAFPGSLAPPCALVVEHDPEVAPSAWANASTMAQVLPVDRVVSIERVGTLDRWHDLALYTTESGRCPSSFAQRYVLTPEEALTWPDEGSPPSGEAVRLPDAEGAARWRVSWDAGSADRPDPVRGLVVLRAHDGAATVALHSNQLRGQAYNYGFYVDASVRGVRLVGRDASGAEVASIVLASGVVGGQGALTPLSATGPWPVGVTPELEVGVDPALLKAVPSAPRTVVIRLD